jgi:hypothetical protein
MPAQENLRNQRGGHSRIRLPVKTDWHRHPRPFAIGGCPAWMTFREWRGLADFNDDATPSRSPERDAGSPSGFVQASPDRDHRHHRRDDPGA